MQIREVQSVYKSAVQNTCDMMILEICFHCQKLKKRGIISCASVYTVLFAVDTQDSCIYSITHLGAFSPFGVVSV